MGDTAKLPSTASKFVGHWGEMGSRWGINRSVAQVQALLYVSSRPLHADEIVTTLGLARSNVSTAVRELQSWGLVRVVHLPGDRRDHFATVGDVWEMFHAILAERKRREFDPAVMLLRTCLAEAKAPTVTMGLRLRAWRTCWGSWRRSRFFTTRSVRCLRRSCSMR